jgi:hypothetical protein
MQIVKNSILGFIIYKAMYWLYYSRLKKLKNVVWVFPLCLLAACNSGYPGNTAPVDSIVLTLNNIQKNSWQDTLQQQLAWAFQQPVPVLICRDSIAVPARLAEQLALADSAFVAQVKNVNGTPYRCEIFGVYPAQPIDWAAAPAQYDFTGCYRVEMYNYALNTATIAVVDTRIQKVLHRVVQVASQPDIPAYLKNIAIGIAANAPEVQQALGIKPATAQALMANTKTALNRSRCERSGHLCVAPTFVYGNKALWAIVDLTDRKLAGIRWTNTGAPQPTLPISQRKLEDDKLMRCYCDKTNQLKRQNWQLDYMLTSSDGLRIANVLYNGKPVLTSAKLVDWHVSYSNTDGFGYSDAVGCPYFSQAAVVAISEPQVAEIKNSDGAPAGFALEQTFKSEGWPSPCNYNYRQRYEFYADGSFRVAAASIGRGCGNDGTYRPVFRIAFAGSQASVQAWQNNAWQYWPKEAWLQQQETTAYYQKQYLLKIGSNNASSYLLAPANGQFADGGRGDNAFIFATVQKPGIDEGESDLTTIGPCCNTDYHQGPEKFIEPQADQLGVHPVVVWYVPQMKNSDEKGKEYCWAAAELKNGVYTTNEYPCFAGPLFVPVKN